MENNKKVDLLEFKFSDAFKNFEVDLKTINSDYKTTKSEIKSLKGFKELSMANFKDFSQEIVKLYFYYYK